MMFFANRGMFLEKLFERSVNFYAQKGVLKLEKRNVEIKIISKSGDKILGKIGGRSGPDYFGCYKGKHIEVELKQTKESFLITSNLKPHQFEHLKNNHQLGGLSFLIIDFQTQNQIIAINVKNLVDFYPSTKKFTIDFCRSVGQELKIVSPAVLDLLFLFN